MANETAPALQLAGNAATISGALPPLLVEALRIAATVILGVHGRKRSGPGEAFWQYRPYSFGDSTQRIDWHKSARSDHVYIRENEWEAANTLWLWPSPAASMNFKSNLSNAAKRDRAQVIALALASLAVRAHERVAALGSPRAPGQSKRTLIRMAEWFLAQADSIALPQSMALPRHSTVVLIGDFLEPPDAISETMGKIAANGANGHVIQIADPAEETLPYEGRVEFLDMKGGCPRHCKPRRLDFYGAPHRHTAIAAPFGHACGDRRRKERCS
jgi:uncharacterized protein (DUF58 family)